MIDEINLDSHHRINCQKWLMENGKSFPKTCQLCGLSGPCKLDMETTRFEGHSDKDAYAVIVTDSYSEESYGERYAREYERLIEFKDMKEFINWIKYDGKNKKYRPIKFQNLHVETEVVVKVK